MTWNGRKILKRLIFGIVVTLLWLVVLRLALEYAARFQVEWLKSHNHLYLVSHGKLPSSPPITPDLSGKPLSVKPIPVSWEKSLPQPPWAADWEVPRKDETVEQKRARRALFPSLSEEDRTWFALGNSDTVMVFDEKGSLREVYDDYYKRYRIKHGDFPQLSVPEIAAKAKEVARTGQPLDVQFNLAPDKRPLGNTDFHFLPAAGLVYVFADLEFRSLQMARMDIPAGSRWEVFSFIYKKNFSGDIEGEQMTTNRYGYRAPDVAVPKPKGVFRILCIGGSTTYEGSDNDHTYPAILEKKLRDLFPGKQIEVLNCGIQGMNSRSTFLQIPAYFELEPDLIIGYLGGTDILNQLELIFYETLSFPYPLLQLSTFLSRNFERPCWPADEVIQTRQRALILTNLEALRRILGRQGIRLALCSLAYVHYDECSPEVRQFCDLACNFRAASFEKESSLLNPQIKKFCEEKGLLYLPVGEIISDPGFFMDTQHMAPRGVELKADVISQCLKDYIAPVVNALN